MNSVDGAPNATILAEGATTTAPNKTTLHDSASAQITKSEKIKTNIIEITVADDANDECHASDNNVQTVVNIEGQLQQQEDQREHNAASFILTTTKTTSSTTATKTNAPAIKTRAMNNTETTNCETETADETASAENPVATETKTTSNETITTTIIKNSEASDVQMINLSTSVAKSKNNDPKCDPANVAATAFDTDNAVTVATDTADDVSITHDSHSAVSKPIVTDNNTNEASRKSQIILAAEGDNYLYNEMKLCRCCGKPNVTLYDLFPNGQIGDSLYEEEEQNDVGNVEKTKFAEQDNQIVQIVDSEKYLHCAQAEAAECTSIPTIEHKTCPNAIEPATLTSQCNKDAAKTHISAKNECKTAANTPKSCYRNIVASITAAAAATTSSNADVAPNCPDINDPLLAAVNGGKTGEAGSGERHASNSSITRIKKSARDDSVTTVPPPRHANANSNSDAHGQASDNMENILQEMQIWQLWIKSNDGLPQRICPKCTAQFYIIHKFRRKCLKVQIRLRSQLNKTNSWEYEELLARATAELTEEQQQQEHSQEEQQQQQTPAQSKPKSSTSWSKLPSKPNTSNCQTRRDQETQTTDEILETTTKTTALSVNLPPVLDTGNDLINDNYNKSAHLLMVGSELGAHNVDNLASSNYNNSNNRRSKLTAARAATLPTSPKKKAITTETISSIVISETIPPSHPLLSDELTKSMPTKVPSSSDLTSLDFEEALDSSRSERSVDQESLLATHIIFKPALNIVSPTTPTRRKYTRRKPIGGHQTNAHELSYSTNGQVKDERCEDDCLTAAAATVNDGDGNGDEVKNEALAWARADQVELEVAAMSAEATATANTASTTTFPTRYDDSCERPAKRVRELGVGGGEEEAQYNDACGREKGEGDQRETEAEIASAALFMDTRHAYLTANEEDATTTAAAMAANSCDAHILIGRYGSGGNVVKAISDEATNAMLLTSWPSKVADDLLRPAVVVNSASTTPMNFGYDVRMSLLEHQQEKPINGQAVAITMGWNQTTSSAMVGATEEMYAESAAVTQAPTNDVQSSKQTLEASEISNLPILAVTKQTTTCNNETVKDDAAAALQIIVSETDAAKAAAAIVDNNKAVITGNTLKSSLNSSLSMRNANDVSKDKGYFGRDEHRLPTDERRFAVENNVAVTDDVDGDDVEGVETLMATVELRPQTTETTTTHIQATTNNQTIKSDVATTTHSEEMILRLKETETQTDLETNASTSNAAFSSSSASSAFVTKAALKAYSTSPKGRSFARRHMQHKFRRTFKGPIAQLLACSPASTSAAAAAFTAMHYKKKHLRRSIGLGLISEIKNDATPASTAITPSTDSTISSSSSNGTIEEVNAPPPQSTFSYYATARRGRRRLKWRERSRLPYFDKHTHQHVNLEEVEGSATINNDVQGDNTTSQTTATTTATKQELPSCFVRLRRLENSEVSDKPTKENIVEYDKSTTDVNMTASVTPFEGEFEAVTVIGSNDDDVSTRITLKRKLPVEEIERLSSTRSPWRTKAEMKESLQQQAALEKAKAAEDTDGQLTIYTKDVSKNAGTYTETDKTEMSYTETCATDGDSAGATSGLERRSKRIKKRRKMWEEAHKQSNAATVSTDGGKVMPIILKLVQEKRPDGCVSCTPKSATTTTAAQIVRGALVSKMTAARYHVVGTGTQVGDVNAVMPQKRRRHRPKRTCCRDGCMTDDTTEDDSATTVGHRFQSSRFLPPPSISQIKGGKMIIDNVNILTDKSCVESTKENCDNNKKERTAASVVSTTMALTVSPTSSNPKASKMSLPSQLVPLLPLLPALLPTSALASAHMPKKDDVAQQQMTPTKTAPSTPMSLKKFSTLVSTTSKAGLQTAPVQSSVLLTETKHTAPSLPAITALEAPIQTSKPTLTTKSTTPLSVVLRNQLIVRVPLSALSNEFKRKFCTTIATVQNTPIKAGPAVSMENVLVSMSPKKTTSPQATARMQETEVSHAQLTACGVENPAHVEHNNKHYGKNNNSCSDDNNTSKSVTAVSLETTAATTTASSTKATIETPQLSTETAGDKRTQSAAGGDINTSKCNTQHGVQAKDVNTQFTSYTGHGGGGSTRYESEQSDFMGFSDGTASSPNGQRGCIAKTNSESNVYNTTSNLHDFISEIAPALAVDESEAPQANELQATLPAGEVTAALLAEAEAEAETCSPLHATSSHTPTQAQAQTPQPTQLLSETNLSEMQDVETTLSGILNEMQDQHIYTPVSSSADDFFAQSVYSPLSEPPATPTHSMYAESPLGGIGSVGSSSMAGGGGSLSVSSSPYVQHIHMEPGSVSSGQMSEPSPLPAPMSVGPSPLHHQQQQATYGKQYANKYGECFTEDSTQSELIGFQNDIPCFENIELVATAAKTASSSPASCHNGQSTHDVEITQNGGVAVPAVAALPIEVDANCKVVDAEDGTVQYIAVAQSSESNANIELVCATEAQTPGLTTSEGAEVITGKDYAVENATLAQLLNDFEATEREALRREEEEERLRKQREIENEQQPQLVQAHLAEQQLMEQQMVQVEVVQAQQAMQQQHQIPQDEVLLQGQQQQQHHHEDDMLKHQQLLQQQKEQEHILRQQLIEQRQQDQLMQQQHLLEQRQQQELLEQQRLQQHQHKQQLYERKQHHSHIYNPTLVPSAKHAPPHARSVQQQQQKQHYVALPPSCAYEAAQMQLAQAADPIQPMNNLGMGVNLYAHNIGPGQEIQWTSSADLTNLSPTFIEAPGAGGGTTYYINAADLYQPNIIAAQEQQRLPSLHHHHQTQQQQHQLREQQLHAIELEKCSMIDANENYIEGIPDGDVAIQRQSCQQQQQQQQQQIMIVIPQDYGTPGTGGATAQLYTTAGTADQPGTTYHLSPAPQTVIMQHGQPQALQMSGVNLSPQFITAQSTQRTGHHTPSPRHLQHYQIHNAATPQVRPTNTLGRPLRCASTPSASNYQHRQPQPAQLIQHPHQLQMQQRQQQHFLQQQQLHQQSDTTKMRMVQHIRARQQALQQQQQHHQLIKPHTQSQGRPQVGVTAVKPIETPSQKVNLVCRFCHKRPKFTSNLDYSNHIIAMHPVETPYNCPYCPMHFTRRVKREKHIVEEHGAHRFQCAQCGQSFCTQRTLDQHLQRAHALEPTTPSTKSTQAAASAGGQRHRQPRQIAPSVKTTQQPMSEQQMQQRRKCYLQQRPTWLERRNRTAATIASSAATAAAASNSQTSMVRVEDVHLQVCDDAAQGKKCIDLQLDTTQLTAESTTKITNEHTSNGSTPISSGNKPQRILCCPDCDDPFNEGHTHAEPCGEQQSHEQQQQQLEQQQHLQQEQQQQQLIQPHAQFDQQEDDGVEDQASNEQLQQREEQLPKPLAKNAHVTLPSPEQTEPDSTSSTNNTAILRQFRKRRASSKYAGMAALLAAGSGNGGSGSTNTALIAAAAAADNSNATEDELFLMERVLRNSHNCLFCDARFTNDIALRKHHQLAHSNQASMPFVCSICKRGFRMRTALQRHMETHDSEGRPYECTLCHVRFPRPSQLTLHKLTVHFLRKPHTCGVCGKQFGTESALKTHSTFHQGHMKTHLPLGVFMSEEDVIQLPECLQQQQQPQEFEEEVDEEMPATEEQEQQPQIEIEQPQQDERAQLQQHQDLEQLLEDEPQDMAEPQTAEPQAGVDVNDNDANNDEDVTAISLNAKHQQPMPELEDEAETPNAEAEMKVYEEQRQQQEQEQAEAQHEEEQTQNEQDQEQANDEHFAQNADELMPGTGSCSPSTTTGISPYVAADIKNVSSDISTTTSNANITTTTCTNSVSGNSLINDSESANGCSSSAK